MASPKNRFLAFYLPQFHPIPENDRWWGPGFTEWTNVVRGQPRFRGHYQPHLPAHLGFYDLRVPETRAAQAELAQIHGIDGFCYYHYWFDSRRLLERPFEEVRRSGEPCFPFALCWANENWTRAWNGALSDVLLRQNYSHEDDLRHIRWLLEVFDDPRYIRVDGKPVFLVYRISSLPDAAHTADAWRSEAQRLGAGDLYLCAVQSFTGDRAHPQSYGFDAAVQFAPDFSNLGEYHSALRRGTRRLFNPRSPYRTNRVQDYLVAAKRALAAPSPPYKRYPCVTPGFDNSARRRPRGATILHWSEPRRYEWWLAQTVSKFEAYSPEENFIFVNAWNEWGEGNHLEPCQRWGTGYLEAHARVAVGDSSHLPRERSGTASAHP